MAAHIMRDSGGRVTSYSFKSAPSLTQIRRVVHQAEKQGATTAVFNAQVGQFQNYEMQESSSMLIRAYKGRRDNSPGAFLGRLKGRGSEPSNYAFLGEIKAATGAERAADLRSVTINFGYRGGEYDRLRPVSHGGF